jgi:hypothetical protein
MRREAPAAQMRTLADMFWETCTPEGAKGAITEAPVEVWLGGDGLGSQFLRLDCH